MKELDIEVQQGERINKARKAIAWLSNMGDMARQTDAERMITSDEFVTHYARHVDRMLDDLSALVEIRPEDTYTELGGY